VSLLPNSKKVIKGTIKISGGKEEPELIINGWNISELKKEEI
jgi:hypothetical protein